ncbi:MAG: P-type conjugative transfer protein VirB9 [Rickettsiales bacterium]|jgi:type IV secretion system protein VirB9|nr:P-type conjugative transfer protein VirB9 [Rickettsiales bacterium]
MLLTKTKLLLVTLLLLSSLDVYAIKEVKPMSVDRRLGVITYSPYDIHRFTGYYGYQSSIIFGEDETIETLSMGDSIPWQMVPNGNRLFLKPIDQDATTNLTLITNKRVYYFELYAKEAQDINEEGLMFAVKFLYADDEDATTTSLASTTINGPDLTNKSLYNFDYTMSGPDIISPVKIFDDGKFTYFEFKDKSASIPAIFYVNADDATEGIINYRMVGDYVVVESTRERFTLRRDKSVVCVYNEALIRKRALADGKIETKKKKEEFPIKSGTR